MIKKIINLLEVIPVNTWDHGFLESVKLQLDKAYTLSDRQKEHGKKTTAQPKERL